MTRLAKKSIKVENFTYVLEKDFICIKGAKGEAKVSIPNFIKLDFDNDGIFVSLINKNRKTFPMLGTTRAKIVSAIKGVTEGFKKVLTLSGTGYKSSVKGNVLEMSLGYSHLITEDIPESVKVTCVKPTIIEIEGVSSFEVGEFASKIVKHRKPIAYKGGEILINGKGIIKKEGKR